VSVEDEIERLSARRHALWAEDRDVSLEVLALTAKLTDLYEAKRISDAKDRAGAREKITRRARIETELEKLMRRDGDVAVPEA
jgi:hypothetical protein